MKSNNYIKICFEYNVTIRDAIVNMNDLSKSIKTICFIFKAKYIIEKLPLYQYI